MDHIITCTTEELALIVTLCDYPEVAKGIAESSLGEKSPEEWQAIMDVTVHQLMLKDIWDSEKDAKGEIPLSDELVEFVYSYVSSEWMLRCSNFPKQGTFSLHLDRNGQWIGHIVDRDILHEFFYVPNEVIPTIIEKYYGFSMGELDRPQEFSLSEEFFDRLSDQDNLPLVREKSNFSAEEKQAFDAFVTDLEECKWSLYNISLFETAAEDHNNEPHLHNIVFFLPSKQGVWMVEMDNSNQERPVKIQLHPESEWKELLQNVGEVLRVS